ncbi:hypothetical protein [Burkholderia gladioli]|uniref:hypothetical protein n=1 Tax=Burkholderia gladioli TaxID=28095 RepID=UPI0009C11333|nr:hypothetical protein [Burkholderia gladioli]MBU9382114.1 hypothetical protein [Burkholderia gladioli]
MKFFSRPDERVFAEEAKAGEVEDFPNVERGWGVTVDTTGGKPPMEWFNWLGRRVDRAIRYFLQNGVPEWSATETYPEGAIVQYNGVMYRSNVENENRAPDGSPGHWGAPCAPTATEDDCSQRVVNTELLAKRLEKYVPEDDLGTYATQEWVKGYAVYGEAARYVFTTDPERSAAWLALDGSNVGRLWTDANFDPSTKLGREGGVITDRVTFSREGWQADIALRNQREGQNVSAYLRASDDGGIEAINSDYTAVTWRVDDWGSVFLRGQLILETNGNLNLVWRGRKLNVEIDDLWANINGKAGAGVRVQWDSGIAEWGIMDIGIDVGAHWLDLPAPWVLIGMRKEAGNTRCYFRAVVLRNQ